MNARGASGETASRPSAYGFVTASQEVVELCECEAARLVLRTDGTLYRFHAHVGGVS